MYVEGNNFGHDLLGNDPFVPQPQTAPPAARKRAREDSIVSGFARVPTPISVHSTPSTTPAQSFTVATIESSPTPPATISDLVTAPKGSTTDRNSSANGRKRPKPADTIDFFEGMPSRSRKSWAVAEHERLAEQVLGADGLPYWQRIQSNDNTVWPVVCAILIYIYSRGY